MAYKGRTRIAKKEEKEDIGIRHVKAHTSEYILSRRIWISVEGSSSICRINNKYRIAVVRVTDERTR
jgi:hypothetical protein